MSRALFRAEDDVLKVRHDAELLAASEAARRQLPALREAFERGLLPGGSIQVKAPFTADDGSNEWMWLDVSKWDGDAIEGLLRNEPDHVPDGRIEGNTTDAIIAGLSAGP